MAGMTFAAPSHADTPSYPKLFFSYSFLYDDVCAAQSPVNLKWAEEATQRVSEFTKIWEKEAGILFGQVFSDFQKGFSRKEMTATLSVCPYAPSYSSPLILNVVRFLKSYMGSQPIRSDAEFADLVFHELLHTWVSENVKRPTPLTLKYKDESRPVLAHLHLMAIQKHTYVKLGKMDLVAMIDSHYSNMQGAYPRAWEIVNAIEGYETFIAEIKSQ